MERNIKHRLFAGTVIFGMTLIPLSLLAADTEIEQIMKDRFEKFEQMGEAYDEINREVELKNPDYALIKKHAIQIEVWANEGLQWFPVGSGPESGIKTSTKAEVWSKPAKFRALQDEFIIEARELKTISISGPLEKLSAQFKKTGDVCSECHELYRKKASLFSIFGN